MYQREEQTSERLMTVGELARRTGTSAKAIRQFQYGHLARDGHENAIRLLDSYRAPRHSTSTRWTLGGH